MKSVDQGLELEEDFERYAAEQQQARNKLNNKDSNKNVNKLSKWQPSHSKQFI